ncbi:MAG: NAD(+) synthase, partial [Acidobacteria bacterium]|nr:NAD(+) synthase [Candidatus Polarisedimenticola svalbardensis]
HRKGIVVAMSGGIDSSAVAALAVSAVGPERVHGLMLPEHDSSGDSLRLATILAEKLGIGFDVVDIGPALEAMGCYRYRNEAIREVFPDFEEDWKSKIVLPPLGEKARLNVYSLVVQKPDGSIEKKRLPLKPYLQLVAATNMKQRTRKATEYFHADRLNYAVSGTPNRLEYDQGFFVKGGDGLADLKPIAHLYKTQVYAMAEHLGVPDEICKRPPTTDTYSMPQSQEEFYFALPYDLMDLCLYAHNHGVPAEEVAEAAGLNADQVRFVFKDIDVKRRTTRYLHMTPRVVEPIGEIHPD